ncbi:MAG: transcription antitermination factor NusB [Clostridia bacterium]
MTRKEAREELIKLVYEFCMNGERNDITLEEICSHDEEKTETQYITTSYQGIIDNYLLLKEKIAEVSKGFAIGRIYKVDLAIMLVALYEILYIKDIPNKVSVNEAVNLAKIYSTDKSATFINGILSGFIKL